MRKKVVFTFLSGLFPVCSKTVLDLVFHRDGLFRTIDDIGDPSRRLCPVDDLDWGLPELHSATGTLPSILLRFVMHPSIICQYAPPDVTVSATSDFTQIENSIVVLHKTLLQHDDVENLVYLKKRNNILLFDMLDYNGSKLEEKLAVLDGLILCSNKAYAHYSDLDWVKKPIFYVTHCIDTRIPERAVPLPAFSPLFHGAPENMLYYPSLARVLNTAFCYSQYTSQEEWLQKTLEANFFYALRPDNQGFQARPFQKGFTAAQLDSNILIHRNDGDALHYLGEDYPYMIHEEPTEEVVYYYMKMARKDFDGPQWHRGLEIMRGLKPHYAPAKIGGEFWDMMHSFI